MAINDAAKRIGNGLRALGNYINKHKKLYGFLIPFMAYTLVPSNKAKPANLFFYGGLGYNPRTSLNEELAKVSDGEKIGSVNGMAGLEATFGKNLEFGAGGNYNFGNKTDTYLTGMDESQIPTGSVSIKNLQLYGLVQKLWEIKKGFELGLYATTGLDYEMRKQIANDQTYDINTANAKISGGTATRFGGGKVQGQIRVGGGNTGLEVQGGVNVRF